jgi:hypothetical protein
MFAGRECQQFGPQDGHPYSIAWRAAKIPGLEIPPTVLTRAYGVASLDLAEGETLVLRTGAVDLAEASHAPTR